jgi:signal transduction histidine kinase
MGKRISKLQEYLINNVSPLFIELVDPDDLIGEVKDEFKNQLDTFSIALVSDIRISSLWPVDKQAVSSILKYLVSNSIAFHDPEKKEKKIVVRIDFNLTGSILEVQDNGLGIREEQQSRIFDVFFRGTEDTIGPGMGLFLAKSLVDKMGGTIRCRSTRQEGTSMLISFPYVMAADKTEENFLLKDLETGAHQTAINPVNNELCITAIASAQ